MLNQKIQARSATSGRFFQKSRDTLNAPISSCCKRLVAVVIMSPEKNHFCVHHPLFVLHGDDGWSCLCQNRQGLRRDVNYHSSFLAFSLVSTI